MNNIENENTYKKFQQRSSGTSTPNTVKVSTRKPIHHNDSVSPITRTGVNRAMSPPSPKESSSRKRRSKSEVHSNSNSDQSESSCSEEDDEEIDSPKSYSYETSSRSHLYESSSYLSKNSNLRQTPNQLARCSVNRSEQRVSNGFNLNILYGCLSIAALGTLYAACVSVISLENTVTTNNTVSVTIKELQDFFPQQSETTWNALETGIEEVISFNKPSVFLLLYEDEAEETLNYMLKNISKYAACVLKKNCEVEPIVLTRTILGTAKAVRDYGYVIDKYKPELEEKGVMIVKNLDKIPGEVAQVFHSMCDEFTPLVERTVFFFTIRIENLPKSDISDLQIVEELLRNNWSVLDDDIFYPLFTRISNMVLRIVPEKT